MNEIDDLIGRALTEEDRALLASHGEPGYLTQASGLFRGPQAWTMWLVNIAGGAAFLVGAWALWRMVGAADVAAALKWGVAAMCLFQATTLCKTLLGSRMEANRLLREVKRIELQLALLRERQGLAG